MRSNLEGQRADGLIFNKMRFQTNVQTLGGTFTLLADSPTVQCLDPGGSSRDVVLPAEAASEGLMFIIVNRADAAEDLTVEDDGESTVIVVPQGGMGIVVCGGGVWSGLVDTDTDT